MNAHDAVEVLPGGFTIRPVASGLFEMTYATGGGVMSGLISAGEIEAIVRQYRGEDGM